MSIVDEDPHRAPVAADPIAAALFDAMSDPTAVLDPDGNIVAVNRAWRAFSGVNGGDADERGVGVSYLDVCRRSAESGCADARMVFDGLVAVLGGETVERTLDYECSSPKVVRWFMVRITPIDHPELGALVSHTNITRRLTTERIPASLARLGDRDQLALCLNTLPTGAPGEACPAGIGVLYIHVDGLTAIGDTLGEDAREEVVQLLSWRLSSVTRPHDRIASLGEHDFAVTAPGMTSDGLSNLVARVRHAFGEAIVVQGDPVQLGVSVGAYLASAGADLTDCLRLADEAAYPIRCHRDLDRSGTPVVDHGPQSALHPSPRRGPPIHPGPAPAPPVVVPTQRQDCSDHVAELERRLSERTNELQWRSSQLTAARKELEDFSHGVSHDLRAPLRAVHGFARILMEDHAAALDADAQHCLDRIQAAAHQMGQQLDGLLTISRLQRRQLSHDHLDVTSLVHRAWEQVRPAGAAVTFEVAVLPGVLADRELVTQLLVHLLDNAVKFTAGTGAPRIEVTAETSEDVVFYVVRDNGVGFDMQSAHRLFTPFQRLHRASEFPGIGIGLAVVQQIVRLHGGSVDTSSAVGEGASFRFSLGPATTQQAI